MTMVNRYSQESSKVYVLGKLKNQSLRLQEELRHNKLKATYPVAKELLSNNVKQIISTEFKLSNPYGNIK